MYESFKILLNALISWDNVQAPEGASELIEVSAYSSHHALQQSPRVVIFARLCKQMVLNFT